jgi:hypothetical protein
MELTSHALLRCDQRRISQDDIETVLDYGTQAVGHPDLLIQRSELIP